MPVQLRWIKLSETQNLPKTDFIKSFKVEGCRICLVHHEGKYFATQSKCPHAGADLSQGWCKNGKLICPFHRYEYDLLSGRGAPGQNDYLDTYPIKIEQNGIYIGWKESWLTHLLKKFWKPKSS